MIQGLLFDLDDTLISRGGSFLGFCKKFYFNFLAETEISLEKFLILTQESDSKTKWSAEKSLFFDDLRKNIDLADKNEKYVKFFWKSMVESVIPDLKANKYLEWLNQNKTPWGIVTNGFEYQHEKMLRSGLNELAPFYIISGEFGCHKPCKEIFIAGSEKLGLNCDNILFVGDTVETDIVGAKNVGMKTAWITMNRNYPESFDLPDYQISHVEELKTII